MTTILVYEYVTGGGLVGRDLPKSWAAEGLAMRRAIVEDFRALPDVRVVTSVDARLSAEETPGVEIRSIADGSGDWFKSVAADADFTVLIAPESDGILADLTRTVSRVGGRSLGSNPLAVNFVEDKARLAHHFVGKNIPSPQSRLIGKRLPRVLGGGPRKKPLEWNGPTIIKPRLGAGSVDTVVVRPLLCPSWVPRDQTFVAQPYLPGRPMSASFLVDTDGQPTLLAVGRQRIEVDADGRISYQGGTIPWGLNECPAIVLDALASVVAFLPKPNLRGFVGVDFLLGDRGEATVLEINPRPTTSFVGLARLFPTGIIAGAWLAACEGPLASTDWPDRLRLERVASPISFDADGAIRPRPGEEW